MAFIPTLNTVQARPQFQSGTGTLAENVWYFATLGVPTEDDLNEIGGLLHTWFLDALMPITTANWLISGIALRAMNEAEGIEINYITGFPIIGGAVVAAAPNNVAYTVTLNTGLVGRAARGRIYGLGIPLSNTTDGNRLTDAARAAYQSKYITLQDGLATGGHAMQVVSFQEGGVPRAAGRPLPVLAVNVRFPLATQRRRYT